MLVIGLTGGIASGKTAVSDAFGQLGVPVIDTDILARELVQPGQPALMAIAQRFGEQCLTPAGELDRGYLRQLIFADETDRNDLEAILHPRIRAEIRDRLALLKAPYCLVVIPLLTETGMNELIQRVLVVDVPAERQIERLIQRDNSDAEQARRILTAQASRAERLAIADDVVENTGSLAELDEKVAKLHRRYEQLAADHCGSRRGR